MSAIYKNSSGGTQSVTLIDSQTANNTASSVNFTSFSGTYQYLQIVYKGLKIVQGGATRLWMRFSTNGGASYDSGGNYSYSHLYYSSDSGTDWNRGAAQDHILFNQIIPESITSTDNGGGEVNLYSLDSTTQYKMIRGNIVANAGTKNTLEFQSGSYNIATAVNGIQFVTSDGSNIFSGTFKLYGIS